VARSAGRFGRLYVAIASGGEASLIPFVARWTLTAQTDRYDVTAQGDDNKQYVAGLPDASGTFSGFLDVATAQTYTAATDGVARKFYLYPSTASAGTYWFGTGFFDFNMESPVDGAETMSGSWSAASPVAKVTA
jgi:hypothetical protein